MNVEFFGFRRFDTMIDRIAEKIKDKKMKFYPSIAGPVVFILFSITILILMPGQIKIRADQMITARTFPTFLAMIMLGGSVILLLREGLKVLRKVPLETIELNILTELKALILMGLLILYAVLVTVLGFTLSSVLFSLLMLYFFRVKNWKYYLIVVIAAVSISLLFRYGLNVRFP
ncbi:MAG: tripartite tricarboxylate transporter TctB family protein [Spirochaetales bacterium]|nr:tripartite tricarboxylate transporter TctB family protein [Spirochaetales bacterium]